MPIASAASAVVSRLLMRLVVGRLDESAGLDGLGRAAQRAGAVAPLLWSRLQAAQLAPTVHLGQRDEQDPLPNPFRSHVTAADPSLDTLRTETQGRCRFADGHVLVHVSSVLG